MSGNRLYAVAMTEMTRMHNSLKGQSAYVLGKLDPENLFPVSGEVLFKEARVYDGEYTRYSLYEKLDDRMLIYTLYSDDGSFEYEEVPYFDNEQV